MCPDFPTVSLYHPTESHACPQLLGNVAKTFASETIECAAENLTGVFPQTWSQFLDEHEIYPRIDAAVQAGQQNQDCHHRTYGDNIQ